MPSTIEQVHQEFQASGLLVLAVNMAESKGTVTAWARDRKLTMPVLLDGDGAVWRAWGVAYTPTVFLVGRDGKLLGKAIGNKSWTGDKGRALLRGLVGP